MTVHLRMATPADAAQLIEIYSFYVTDTSITFEVDIPDEAEFARRVESVLARYPYLVAEKEGKIIGYAYAGAFNARKAYDWTVESTVYVSRFARGMRIGERLYRTLEALLSLQGVRVIEACIAFPDQGSVAFHKKHGYQKVAHFNKVGYKQESWWDVVWYEKRIINGEEAPLAVIPVRDLPEDLVAKTLISFP